MKILLLSFKQLLLNFTCILSSTKSRLRLRLKVDDGGDFINSFDNPFHFHYITVFLLTVTLKDHRGVEMLSNL